MMEEKLNEEFKKMNKTRDFNTLDKFGKVLSSHNKLYHLITDTGFFYVNGIKVRDYNSAIENILDVRDKLYALS